MNTTYNSPLYLVKFSTNIKTIDNTTKSNNNTYYSIPFQVFFFSH